jgi:hypothetical protein
MRTTVTLEPQLAARIKDLAHRRRASFKATLNDVLRRGLSGRRHAVPRFVVKAHRGGFRTDIDPARLNQLVDELDVEDIVAGRHRRP